MLKKVILSLFVMLMIGVTMNGQNRNFGATVFGGYANAYPNSHRVEISIHPHYNLGAHFAIEGQASALFYQGSGLTGQSVTNTVSHLLAGGRFYFTKPERTWRPYVNALFGLLQAEQGDTQTFGLYGGSLGLYMTHKKGYSFGVAYQTETELVFRVGYRF